MNVTFKNNATSVIEGPLLAAATSVTIRLADASRFPSPSGNAWFPLTLSDSLGRIEVVKVTGRSSNVLTVVRAQEGTTAIDFPAGARAELRLTAGSLNAAFSEVGAAAAEGDVTLGAAIASEVSARTSGDASNAAAIGAETSARIAADDALRTLVAMPVDGEDAGLMPRVNAAGTRYELQDPDEPLNLNSDLRWWRRGAGPFNVNGSGPPGYGGPYTADRYESWAGYTPSGTAADATVVRGEFATGQTDVPGNPRFYLRHTQTVMPYNAGTPANINPPTLRYRVDDVRSLSGATVLAKLWVRVASGTSRIAIQLRNQPGLGGATPPTNASPFMSPGFQNVTTTWQELLFYVANPLLVPASFDPISDHDSRVTMDIQMGDLSGASFIMDFAQIRLYATSANGRFIRVPGRERPALDTYYQRKYFKAGGAVATGMAKNADTAYFVIPYGNPFRSGVAPIPTISDISHFFIEAPGGFVTGLTSHTFQSVGWEGCILSFTKTGAFTAKDPLILYCGNTQFGSIMLEGEYAQALP